MYLIIRISNLEKEEAKDKGTLRKSVYEANDLDSALASMYGYLSVDIKDANVLSTLVYVEETNGNVHEKHYWQKTNFPVEETVNEEVTE